MNRKRIMVICTLLLALSIGEATWGKPANARPSLTGPAPQSQRTEVAASDDLLHMIGMSSEEQLYYALYNGQTLADLAQGNHTDAQSIVDLQVAQLTEQLDDRLANRSITREQYEAHKSELTQVVAKSVYGL